MCSTQHSDDKYSQPSAAELMDGQAEHWGLVVAVCVFIVVKTEGGAVAWDPAAWWV